MQEKRAKNATIIDVANLAGVSKATASRVINNLSGVSREMEERVRMAVKALNYHPNTLARALKVKKTKSIGLIVPTIENTVFAQLTTTIEKKADTYGFSLVLCNSQGLLENEIKYVNLLIDKQVDGMIFDAMGQYDKRFAAIRDYGIPTVWIGKKIDGIDAPIVTSDNFLGGYTATMHLVRTGCRCVAFLAARTDSYTAIEDRYRGYCKALSEAGIPEDKDLAVLKRLDYEESYGETGILIRNRPGIDGIFAANDVVAAGCLKRLLQEGVSIPGEISIIGYDDTDLSKMIIPQLSSVKNPVEAMGIQAVKMLLSMIYTGKSIKTERVFQPVMLLRETTKPLKEIKE